MCVRSGWTSYHRFLLCIRQLLWSLPPSFICSGGNFRNKSEHNQIIIVVGPSSFWCFCVGTIAAQNVTHWIWRISHDRPQQCLQVGKFFIWLVWFCVCMTLEMLYHHVQHIPCTIWVPKKTAAWNKSKNGQNYVRTLLLLLPKYK